MPSTSYAWKRLNGLAGDLENVTSTRTPTGLYFVGVFAFKCAVECTCPIEKVE